MNKIALTAATLLVGAGLAVAQPQEPDHQAHHPDSVASAPARKQPTASTTAGPVKSSDANARMTAMQDMHQKMMTAKTPEERQALMGEHVRAMQGGMSMMKEMSGGGGGASTKGALAPPKTRMEAMEQRMDMMQLMMEMMLDHVPAAPANNK